MVLLQVADNMLVLYAHGYDDAAHAGTRLSKAEFAHMKVDSQLGAVLTQRNQARH